MSPEQLAAVFAEERERLRQTVMLRLNPRLLGRVDADDVLQESFLASQKRLEHYKADTTSAFVWVRRIVLQTLADISRRHLGALMRSVARERLFTTDGDDGATAQHLALFLVATGTSPMSAAARSEAVEQIVAAIERMSPIDQEILTLRHFEELSNGEVAEVLGLHKAAATNRYLRAMERLRAVLIPTGTRDELA